MRIPPSKDQPCNLVGLIPTAQNVPFDKDALLDDSLVMIGKNIYAIQKAIAECAFAGCRSIFIICYDHLVKIFKKVLKSHVEEPTQRMIINKKGTKSTSFYKREPIPIYYLSIPVEDEDVRDSLVWNVIYAANILNDVYKNFSNFITPNKFFVASPYSIYPIDSLRKYRAAIKSDRRFYVETAKDQRNFTNGAFTSFTFTLKEAIHWRRIFLKKATKKRYIVTPGSYKEGRFPTTKFYPTSEQYSGRFFTFQDVLEEFNPLLPIGSIRYKVDWYYEINSWEQYAEYMAKEGTYYGNFSWLFFTKEIKPIKFEDDE